MCCENEAREAVRGTSRDNQIHPSQPGILHSIVSTQAQTR